MTGSVLALSGSARAESVNRKLLALARARLAAHDVETEEVDLRALDLPIYDGDLDEQGQPATVDRLRKLIAQSAGLLIAAPEYNHSLAPLLKNAIDWVSHPMDRQPFKGKVTAIMSAAARPWGGTRMLPHLRDVLVDLGCMVIPSMVAVPVADRAFDAEGKLLNAQTAAFLDQGMIELSHEIGLRHRSQTAPDLQTVR